MQRRKQLAPPTRERLPGPARAGISLMEVLISIFVIAIGLLGIAALIPVANYALKETGKSDRTAACGQAATRDVRVRALADPDIWAPSNRTPFDNASTYIIDPLGGGVSFGAVPTVVLNAFVPASAHPRRDRVFFWQDDLLFDMGQDDSARPQGFAVGADKIPISEQSYSWFLTVTPSPMREGAANERRQCIVSVAVCYKRDFGVAPIEVTAGVAWARTPSGVMISGVKLPDGSSVDMGQWVLLKGLRNVGGTDVVHAQWYRVAAGSGLYYVLEGPNWPALPGSTPDEEPYELSAANARLIVLPSVLGVYTTTVELNRSPQWLR